MNNHTIHGKLQNIYRVLNHEHDDLDLTREQAIRLYQQLRTTLYPRAPRVSTGGRRGSSRPSKKHEPSTRA